MNVRNSLRDLGSAVLMGTCFVLCFIAPALATIAEVILITLKLLGCIGWSWVVVILAPVVIEAIPLVLLPIGFALVALAGSPSQDANRNS